MKDISDKESPFACDMTAIAADQRDAHLATINELFRAGYSFRLPNESNRLLKTAEFIALERLCYPFFGFGLEVEREGGAVWLSLTGREGVKPFIMAEIGNHLPVKIISTTL